MSLLRVGGFCAILWLRNYLLVILGYNDKIFLWATRPDRNRFCIVINLTLTEKCIISKLCLFHKNGLTQSSPYILQLNGLSSSDTQNLDGPGWTPTDLNSGMIRPLSHLVHNPVTPCTRLCHTLYQTLSYLVPNPVTTCSRLFHTSPVTHVTLCCTLYQTLSHLVPNTVSLLHLVLDFVTPCTKPILKLFLS